MTDRGKAHCPDCGVKLSMLIQSRPKYDNVVYILIPLAGVVTLVWGAIVINFIMDLAIPGIRRLVLITALLPGFGIVVYALSRPKVKTLKCHKCPWTKTTRLKRRKKGNMRPPTKPAR